MHSKYGLEAKARKGLTVLILATLIILFSVGCGSKPKVYRVGILSGLDFFAGVTDRFKARMAELGYAEGKNIIYDFQKTDFDLTLYRKILNKFVADKVDLIFVFPTEAAVEAKAAAKGTDIPVVFANAIIEGIDLIHSVREPGGNITGVRFPSPDIAIKRFEIMCELAPKAKRMWLPYQRGYVAVTAQLKVLHPAAAAAGVTLLEAPADNAEELRSMLEARSQSKDIGMDAILFIAETLDVKPEAFTVIGRFAAEHNIPIGGALMSVGGYESIYGVIVDVKKVGRQAADIADKVLKGTPAGSIPVVSAESYFQINFKAAKKLNLNISEGLLSMANEIIR